MHKKKITKEKRQNRRQFHAVDWNLQRTIIFTFFFKDTIQHAKEEKEYSVLPAIMSINEGNSSTEHKVNGQITGKENIWMNILGYRYIYFYTYTNKDDSIGDVWSEWSIHYKKNLQKNLPQNTIIIK